MCGPFPNCSYREKKRRGASDPICSGSQLQFAASGSRPACWELGPVMDPTDLADPEGSDLDSASEQNSSLTDLSISTVCCKTENVQSDMKSLLAGDTTAITSIHLCHPSSISHEEWSSWGFIFSHFLKGVLKMTCLIKSLEK